MRDAIAILVLAIFLVACDKSPADTGPPPGLQPIAVRVDGPTDVAPSIEVQFTALQTWSDGSTRDVTASAQWTSSNPSVLSVSAGLAKGMAGGEVGLTAQVAPLTSQPKSVRVVPSRPEWEGRYTLTIGGGACNASLPLPLQLRQRTYTAVVLQSSLMLYVSVPNGVESAYQMLGGSFWGQIFNPQVRFSFDHFFTLGRRVERVATTQPLSRSTGSLTLAVARREPRFYLSSYGRSAYPSGPRGFVEVLSDSNRLVITGEATTTMSPSGFAGTLNGALTLYGTRATVLGVCSSSSHGFTLVRK